MCVGGVDHPVLVMTAVISSSSSLASVNRINQREWYEYFLCAQVFVSKYVLCTSSRVCCWDENKWMKGLEAVDTSVNLFTMQVFLVFVFKGVVLVP